MPTTHNEHNRDTGVRMKITDDSVIVQAREPMGITMSLSHATALGQEFLRRHNQPPDPANPWSSQVKLVGNLLVFRESFASDTRWMRLSVVPVVEMQKLRWLQPPEEKMVPTTAILTVDEFANMVGKWQAATEALAVIKARDTVQGIPTRTLAADVRAG